MSDADDEVAETQVWLDFARACGYMSEMLHIELYGNYNQISGGLVRMMADPAAWCGPATLREEQAIYFTNSPSDNPFQT